MPDGTPVDPVGTSTIEATDDGTGSDNAAELAIGDHRGAVAVYWDSTGSATLTVEVMRAGSWETFDTVDISSDDSETEVYPHVPYDQVRAYLDQARNEVVVTAKGG